MPENASDMISDILSNPDMIGTIMGLIGQMGGNSSEQADSNAEAKAQNDAPDLSSLMNNMDLIMKMQSAFEIMNSNDDSRLTLLLAIKPYLSKKRLTNVDKAINIMRMSKLTGLLEGII